MSELNTSSELDEEPTSFRDKVVREAREWLSVLAWFIPAYFIFTGLVYEQRVIPSESMVPNLQVGDRVAVNKFVYGYSKHSVPFSLGRYLPLPEGRIFASMPKRGDVVVFEHPHTARVMIKRVLAVGGDKVQLRNKQVFLNDEPIPTEDLRRITVMSHPSGNGPSRPIPLVERRERLGETSYLVYEWDPSGLSAHDRFDTTEIFVVPEGHLFFVGDNRDNSVDARSTSGHCLPVDSVISATGCPKPETAAVGFVPLKNVIGRADTVIFTTKRCTKQAGITCPPKRVWKGL